jgi:hypothetical protein
MRSRFGKGGRLRRSGPGRIIAGSLIDFGRRHLPRDVSHLLTANGLMMALIAKRRVSRIAHFRCFWLRSVEDLIGGLDVDNTQSSSCHANTAP